MAKVREANFINLNILFLVRFAVSRLIFWILEQPAMTRFFWPQVWIHFLNAIAAKIFKTLMSAFGKDAPKLTMLDSDCNRYVISMLKRSKLKRVKATGKYYRKSGNWHVNGTGNTAEMGAYP